jgi:hypothetical protein
MSIRNAASCGHPLHVRDVPRGAEMDRAVLGMFEKNNGAGATPKGQTLEKQQGTCQSIFEKRFS